MFELLPLILVGVLFIIVRGSTKRIDRLEKELGEVRERLLRLGGADIEPGGAAISTRAPAPSAATSTAGIEDSLDGEEPPLAARAAIAADAGPLLVFLHGTGSSCEGSFGGLWDAANREGAALRRRRFVDGDAAQRPAHHHGKPSSPPATIAATETIEGLCRTLLPSDLLPGRRGRG